MRPTAIASSVLLFAAASTAWPWPSGWQPFQMARRDVAPMVERQADSSSSSKFELSITGITQGNTATTEKGGEKTTAKSGASASAPASGSVTATASNRKSTDDGGSKTTAKASDDPKTTAKTPYETTKTFDPRLPAGGISMVTPNIMSGPQYYRVSDYVTLAWNYTSLKVTPTAVDILASCSLNSATYTLALNQSVTAPTQALTWDTGEFQKTAATPLVIAMYTLVVYDSDSSVSAAPQAGYLGVSDQFTFGMYISQPYTPMAEYVCATCNGAGSLGKQTLGFLLGTVAVTVLSFGWFAGVAGLW